MSKPTVLITGASTGIGATYADRFARRGHALVLVARDVAKLEALAAKLRAEAGVAVDVLPADLTDPADVAKVEARLADDAAIGVLINNAGASLPGAFTQQSGADVARLVALNISAVTVLANAAARRFAAEGQGAIVNIGSVVGLAPEFAMAVYGGSKAYVLHFSQALQAELGPKGVYVQAVLPAATRTEIWKKSGRDADQIPGLMEVDDLVDAALVGFDRREPVTIPPLPDHAAFEAFDNARKAMLPGFGNAKPGARYRANEPA
ncbi:SDR family oxidoreductase [Phenylobacterium sp. J367]|uniref:SDR family NAD(P)-dependent oxidoreductase n=1 Tax=Phenylobacterium sp. J367 TaxID=2898435 RepID=UPI0021508739|nr:SDR family oxidoreductase [Phenylobacterium sp. J367]MCR5880627.1 SDR family oxidoreductase [Phenylobacterium sp. J367]